MSKNFITGSKALLLLSAITLTAAAAPRLYVTGDIGVYSIVSGSTPPSSVSVQRDIDSGTKSLKGVRLGVELTKWFSVEAGYNWFASSTTEWPLRPGVITLLPVSNWLQYQLRSYTISPVFSVPIGESFSLKFFGGWLHGDGSVTLRNRFSPSYSATASVDDDSLFGGIGFTYKLSKHFELTSRATLFDLGTNQLSSGRIKAIGYTAGLSWRL